jgi:hypothetical protein
MKMPFIDQMVEDKARNRVVREIAMVDSEWPAHTGAGLASCSGYATPVSGSGAVVVRVPSGFWFKPRTVWLDNQNAALNHITLYEGGSASACSGVIGGIYVDGHTTNFVA